MESYPTLQDRLHTAGCTGGHPAGPGQSPEQDNPQPPWAACSSALSPHHEQVPAHVGAELPVFQFMAISPHSCPHRPLKKACPCPLDSHAHLSPGSGGMQRVWEHREQCWKGWGGAVGVLGCPRPRCWQQRCGTGGPEAVPDTRPIPQPSSQSHSPQPTAQPHGSSTGEGSVLGGPRSAPLPLPLPFSRIPPAELSSALAPVVPRHPTRCSPDSSG